MRKKKIGKLARYAETRIWNLKRQEKAIATSELIDEIIMRYKLIESAVLRDELKIMIRQARRRVYQRESVMKKNIRLWSVRLGMTETDLKYLAYNGILTKGNIEAVYLVLEKYRSSQNS